jgi:hypothetical protein
LLQRRQSLLQCHIRESQLIDLLTELIDLSGPLLQIGSSLIQFLNRTQTDPSQVLHTNRSVAGAQLKRLEEVFRHRAHVTNAAAF